MNLQKTSLPSISLLSTQQPFDYVDSFVGTLHGNNQHLSSSDIGKAFFTSAPAWVGKLFDLRNRIVQFFGLKTSGKIEDQAALLASFGCNKGERLGLFQVFEKTAHEVILGEDDKHLNFRVSLLLEKKTDTLAHLTISTTVKFHNIFGRLYFLPVRPFHRKIVPIMLKGIIQNLEKSPINLHFEER